MPAYTASVVLNAARTFLNDDNATLWTDATLMPKLQQAHRELQIKLRFAGSPIMRQLSADQTVNFSTAGESTLGTIYADLIEPIKLFERAAATAFPGPAASVITEIENFPIQTNQATIGYWQWFSNENIRIYPPSGANRIVNMIYWRQILVPSLNTDTLSISNAELYIAPRTAALAAESTGAVKLADRCNAMADKFINMVILSNRGRLPAAQNPTARS